MATLYTLVESNKRKTQILMIFLFALILSLGWIFSEIFNSKIILYFSFFLALFQNFLAFWYSDKIVLALTKAKPIEKRDNPRLYRIVENLCITAGLPLPKIYILEEQQPNAFATGRDEKHAAIAVTKGLLEKLEKVELEGVIAHEISHIKNRDILLQSVIIVLVGFIIILTDIFWRMSFWGRREKRKKGGELFSFLGILVIILAPLVAKLIQLAISRKREFLADASGALLTRYPEGLASALEKIAKDQTPMRAASNSTAHLFIANPFKGREKTGWLAKLFMTHPPIEERIRALRQMSI